MPRADRAGGETLNHGRLPRNNRSLAEDGLQDVRGTSVLQRPERSGDRKTSGGRLFCNDRSGAETLDPWGQGPLPLLKLKRAKP